MSFRNHNNGTCVSNTKKRIGGEHQLSSDVKSSHSSSEHCNGMWRRTKHSSHNAYTTLPRKIHSTQPSNHSTLHNKIPDDNSATTGRRTISSAVHTMKNPRDGLHLPVSSIRNQCPPLPPTRGDSSVRRSSERRLSDITYAELSMTQQIQNNAENNNNLGRLPNPTTTVHTYIAPLSEGVPAELRVTSPTTVYATIGMPFILPFQAYEVLYNVI